MKLEDMQLYAKFKAVDKNGSTVRCQKEKETVFVFGKNRRHYGWRLTESEFAQNYTIKEGKTEQAKWEHNVDRVIKTLEKSGLWTDVLEMFKNLKAMGWAGREKIKDEYDALEYDEKFVWKDNRSYNSEKYNKWLDEVEKQYPFLIKYNKEKDSKYLNTTYLYDMSRAKLKSMYFGWSNAQRKEEIREHIISKKELRFMHTVGYDVSFEYNAELGKAWYSEEYRGCGNGHYYIALDNNVALFCEDD